MHKFNTLNLSGPQFPQMVNDGYITSAELQSAEGVIVQVLEYPNYQKGDYINLYWDGRLLDAVYLGLEDNFSWPWTTVIPEAYAVDGSHQVWYTVIDVANNPSTSITSSAIVFREFSEGLTPPVFTDKDSDNVISYDTISEYNGTHLHIPYMVGEYDIGDTLYIYWRLLLNDVTVDASEYSVSHVVSAEDIVSGFDIIIPASYIAISSLKSTGEAWYAVIPNNGEAKGSASAYVTIDSSENGMYPAPVVPLGGDGWLDCFEITTEGVNLNIPANAGFKTSGKITLSWQGYNFSGQKIEDALFQTDYLLTENDIINGFNIDIPSEKILPIGIGYAEVWYQIFSPSSPGISSIRRINIDTQHCTRLPAPVFTNAVDSILTQDSVAKNGGTDLIVRYSDLNAGDIVTAYWVEYDNNSDTPLAGSAWVQTRTVTPEEVSAGYMTFLISENNFVSFDENKGIAKYEVKYSDGGIAISEEASVTVSLSVNNTLLLNCSTGAPVFDPLLTLRPINTVVIMGPPGADVELSLPTTANAWFNPDGQQLQLLRLDEKGRASASVYSFNLGNVTISAYVVDEPSLNDTGTMTFTDWSTGKGDLSFYGVTTGAVADGVDTCTVWLRTEPTSVAKEASLVISNNTQAILPQTGSKSAQVDITVTNTAYFDITDSFSEMVPFTLSLLNVSGAYITNNISFIDITGSMSSRDK